MGGFGIDWYITVKMEGKQPKLWGVLMDKQNHPIFPYRPPNLLVLQWAKKKSSPAFANPWLLLVAIIKNLEGDVIQP